MRTKIILSFVTAVSLFFFGFSQLNNPKEIMLDTNYTLTLEDIGPLTSYGVYSVNGGYYVNSYSGSFAENTNVTITATSAIQGNDSTDYYFFSSWSDGNTSISRTITITSNITLYARYKNKQGIYWVPGGLE